MRERKRSLQGSPRRRVSETRANPGRLRLPQRHLDAKPAVPLLPTTVMGLRIQVLDAAGSDRAKEALGPEKAVGESALETSRGAVSVCCTMARGSATLCFPGAASPASGWYKCGIAHPTTSIPLSLSLAYSHPFSPTHIALTLTLNLNYHPITLAMARFTTRAFVSFLALTLAYTALAAPAPVAPRDDDADASPSLAFSFGELRSHFVEAAAKTNLPSGVGAPHVTPPASTSSASTSTQTAPPLEMDWLS